jgi:hypothetical protein
LQRQVVVQVGQVAVTQEVLARAALPVLVVQAAVVAVLDTIFTMAVAVAVTAVLVLYNFITKERNA